MEQINRVADWYTALDHYSTVFNNNSIHIIDMYGSISAGYDPAYALVCKIMGILCNEKQLFIDFKNSGTTNTGSGLIYMEVFSYFNVIIKNKNNNKCHFCLSFYETYEKIEHELQVEVSSKKLKEFPIIQTSLNMLVPLAEKKDKQIRQLYKGQIIYSNNTVNIQHMNDATVEMLNVEEFLSDPYWQSWMEGLFRRSLHRGLLCGCET